MIDTTNLSAFSIPSYSYSGKCLIYLQKTAVCTESVFKKYLLVPLMAGCFLPILGVVDSGRWLLATVMPLPYKDRSRAVFFTQTVAHVLLVITLPFRLIKYCFGRPEALFSVDYMDRKCWREESAMQHLLNTQIGSEFEEKVLHQHLWPTLSPEDQIFYQLAWVYGKPEIAKASRQVKVNGHHHYSSSWFEAPLKAALQLNASDLQTKIAEMVPDAQVFNYCVQMLRGNCSNLLVNHVYLKLVVPILRRGKIPQPQSTEALLVAASFQAPFFINSLELLAPLVRDSNDLQENILALTLEALTKVSNDHKETVEKVLKTFSENFSEHNHLLASLLFAIRMNDKEAIERCLNNFSKSRNWFIIAVAFGVQTNDGDLINLVTSKLKDSELQPFFDYCFQEASKPCRVLHYTRDLAYKRGYINRAASLLGNGKARCDLAEFLTISMDTFSIQGIEALVSDAQGRKICQMNILWMLENFFKSKLKYPKEEEAIFSAITSILKSFSSAERSSENQKFLQSAFCYLIKQDNETHVERVTLLRALLGSNKGIVDINKRLINGHTPLIEAVLFKSSQLVSLLLEAGARTDLSSENYPWYGYTALEIAKRLERKDLEELLKKDYSKGYSAKSSGSGGASPAVTRDPLFEELIPDKLLAMKPLSNSPLAPVLALLKKAKDKQNFHLVFSENGERLSIPELTKSFRKLVFKAHPDKNLVNLQQNKKITVEQIKSEKELAQELTKAINGIEAHLNPKQPLPPDSEQIYKK